MYSAPIFTQYFELPVFYKQTVNDFVEFLHSKGNNNIIAEKLFNNDSVNYLESNKKISAKQLLNLPLYERNEILKKQAAQAKIIYEHNPDLLVPDLTDDILEV